MRAAYLELLKLSLCDLAGACTLSVSKVGGAPSSGDRVFSRQLGERELNVRAMGLDWPFSGLTMVGLTRLDDLQACVESVVRDGVQGDVIEAGAWRGGASILARATLDSLGADERTVWVADSFQGLPAPDRTVFPEDRELDLSQVHFLAVPAEEVRGYFARFGCEQGVKLVEGFFEETLPRLCDHRWSVIRLDGDTYEATWVALESLYPGLSAGGYLIVDDYWLIKECRRAVDDFRSQHEITEPIERIDLTGVRWRRESAPLPNATRPGIASGRVRRPRSKHAVERPSRVDIPTQAEHTLESKIRRIGARLAAAEAELGRLRRAPFGSRIPHLESERDVSGEAEQ